MRNFVKLAVAVAVLVAFLAPLAPSQAQTQVVTEERTGIILKLAGTSVIVRNDKNEIKKYNGIPAGMTITVDGKAIKFRDLREGMKYTALRLETAQPGVTITMAEVEATPSAPPVEEAAPAPAPAPAPTPAAEPAPEKLPDTGSGLPLAALLGFGLVGAGLALGSGRR